LFNRKKIEVSGDESHTSNNIKVDKLLTFTTNVNNNHHNKKYEPFNVVADNGDSINSSLSKGEEYVSMSLVIDLVKEIVQQELLAAGVISKK
jgi:hypothetical protein